MSQDQEDPKRAMPTERKSVWRTPEERRMSDLTRVLEWLERRRGKKKLGLQKEKKKRKVAKQQVGAKVTPQVTELPGSAPPRPVWREMQWCKELRGAWQAPPLDPNPRSPLPSPARTHGGICPVSELDIKDAIALESTQRPSMFRRQSSIGDPMLQEAIFSSRRGTLIRDWGSKAQDASFERKLKTLMDKSTEPKMESLKMLKPEEVLSCRYLRLSKNNIRTLLKLCKDAGLNMDIHPHMTESEIDSKKVFGRSSSATP
uniref:Uncharacterized protein n=1 Tax=Urocitellus parryii TaxID=9999 RepID=A0A8D2H4P0_UROPR